MHLLNMKNIFFEKIFIFQAMVFKFGYIFGFIEASNKCKISAQYVHKYACCYCFQKPVGWSETGFDW